MTSSMATTMTKEQREDALLDGIGHQLDHLKEHAVDINHNLVTSTAELDDLREETEETTLRVRMANWKIEKLMKHKSGAKCCCIIVLFITLMILIFVYSNS